MIAYSLVSIARLSSYEINGCLSVRTRGENDGSRSVLDLAFEHTFVYCTTGKRFFGRVQMRSSRITILAMLMDSRCVRPALINLDSG